MAQWLALAIGRSRVRSPAEAYRVTTLGKLFTHMYLCPPSSKVGTSFGWDKCTAGAVLAVGCLQAGPCGWQPTGATPAPLIPV